MQSYHFHVYVHPLNGSLILIYRFLQTYIPDHDLSTTKALNELAACFERLGLD
jgi:hypothetical protein